MYVRHWDRWETKEKSALWVCIAPSNILSRGGFQPFADTVDGHFFPHRYGKLSKDKHGKYKMSKITNALKSTGLECPILPFDGTDNFDICKDCIMFVSKDPDLNPALNVKTNLYIVHLSSWDKSSASNPQRVVIPGFEGATSCPVISKDGRKAAFLSMKTAGYEADKNHILVLPDLNSTDLTPQQAFASDGNYEGSWDRSPSSITFTPNSKSLLAIAEDYGYAETVHAESGPDERSRAQKTDIGRLCYRLQAPSRWPHFHLRIFVD